MKKVTKDVSWNLQKKIYEILKKNLENVAIYSSVPEDVDFPYLVINDFKSEDWSCKDFQGHVVFNHIQIVDSGHSHARIYEISACVRQAIEGQMLEIKGYNVLSSKIIASEMVVSKEGISRLIVKIRTKLCEEL